MARAMGTNAYGKEPRRGERTLSRCSTHRRTRRAFLRPYGAGASLGRSHRAYALGYFLVPLTGLRTAHAQDWPDAQTRVENVETPGAGAFACQPIFSHLLTIAAPIGPSRLQSEPRALASGFP